MMKDHDAGFGKCAWGTAAFGSPASYTYFRYNKAGWLEKQKNFNRTFAYYVWDKAGRESAIHHEKSDATPLVTLDYVRDDNGNITKISRESGRTFYYTYDKTEQLTSEEIKAPDLSTLYSFEYDYDGAGNRLHMIRDGGNTYYTYNKANELLTEFRGSDHAYFYYDGKGNTVRERQADGFNRYYQYDAEDMTTKVHYAPTGDRTHLYYIYNAIKERVEKTNWGPAGQDRKIVTFNGVERVSEHDGAGSPLARSIVGPSKISRVSSPICRLNLVAGGRYSYHKDAVFSVLATTGADAAKNQVVLLDAFGTVLAQSGDAELAALFNSREYSTEIGAHLYFYRHYRKARWTTRDPLSYRHKRRLYGPLRYRLMNHYQSSYNNPVLYIDHAGLFPQPGVDLGPVPAANPPVQDGSGWKNIYDSKDKRVGSSVPGRRNCLSVAAGWDFGSLLPVPGASLRELLAALGWRCDEPDKIKCGPCEKEIMIYLSYGKDFGAGHEKEEEEYAERCKREASFDSPNFPVAGSDPPPKLRADFHAVYEGDDGRWSCLLSEEPADEPLDESEIWREGSSRDPDDLAPGNVYSKKRCCK